MILVINSLLVIIRTFLPFLLTILFSLTFISIDSGIFSVKILTLPLFMVATATVPFCDLVTLVSSILILVELLGLVIGLELLIV